MKNFEKEASIRMMDDLGRVCIPKEIRKKFGFGMGDRFEILGKEGEILLIKVEDEKGGGKGK